MLFSDYEDEFRDFSLLLTNQLLLGIFMTELPIVSYKIEVGTEECKLQNQPFIFKYEWFGGINNEEGDTRIHFILEPEVTEKGEDFKLKFIINTWAIVPFKDNEAYIKEFLFRPTDKTGEAIVNETLKWIREIMIEVMSGRN